MHVSRWSLGFVLLWFGLIPAVLAQPPVRFAATMERSGTLVFRISGTQRVFATLQPGVFESGWQYRTTTAAATPGEAKIRARQSGALIKVGFTAALVPGSDRSVRLRYTLTPDRDLAVQSAHLALLLPVEEWTMAKATIGGTDAIVDSALPKQPAVLSGQGEVILTRRGITVRAQTGEIPVLLQDNRAFGAQELELRFGRQSPEREGRPWKAGVSETVELTLDLPYPVALVREEPVTITAGDDWTPLETRGEIVPGSALDFSARLDAPAGKYGRVIASGGHFGFEKSPKLQRFWGVNLCFGANYLEKPEANRLAERLARLGYNAVRLHHYDSEATTPAGLDKLDYLIAALKKRGIYINTDLYVSRPVPEALSLGDFKTALLVSDPAFANWKEFTRALLTHVNPYTQLAWKDEPALAWLSVVNEPNLTNTFARLSPALRTELDRAWQAWRKGRRLSAVALPAQLTRDPLGRELEAFLTHLHERGFQKMKASIVEIGCKALLTDLNGGSEAPAFMAARHHLDFVDNHFYFDPPTFLDQDGALPSAGGDRGASAIGDGGVGPDRVALTRLFGKPFTISAFDYVAPNHHRAEGGLLLAAAAALQDWDGVWRFAYSHSREAVVDDSPLRSFDLAGDPLAQASERAAQMLFLRGDVRPAPNAVSRVWRRDQLLTSYDQVPGGDFGSLVFVTRVGTWVEDANGPLPPPRPSELRLTRGDGPAALSELLQSNRLKGTNRTNFETDERQSETNEIFINGQFGSLRVVTPRTLGGICPESDAILCGPLKVAAEGADALVYVTALDDRAVTESGHLLIGHLTDVQNTNLRYAGPDQRVLENWGTLPHLVRRGTATLTLTRKLPGKVEAWCLDTTGKRVAPLAVTVEGTTLTFSLSTHQPDGKATIYYEVTVK